MKENADRARALDAAEIAKQIKDTAEQMFRLRFQMSMGQMDGIKKLRSLRKERARMLTVLRERQDGATPVIQRPARAKALPKPAQTHEAAPKKAVKKAAKKATPKKAAKKAVKKAAKKSAPKKSGKKKGSKKKGAKKKK